MKYRIWDKGLKYYVELLTDMGEVIPYTEYYFADGDGGIWKYTTYINKDTYGSELVKCLYENYIIEESTGIEDINGVPLFVGDIVKLNLKYIDQYITVEIRDDNIAQVKVHDIIEKIGTIHEVDNESS